MPHAKMFTRETLPRDLTAGSVVFLVALPLCLGVALASSSPTVNVPMFSGLLAGIVGGIVVGLLSGSHTSVSGPAAGLTAIVAVQLTTLGSFEAFLFAVMIGGAIQIVFALLRLGFIAAFFPSSVIKGLLAAIGVILILKQIPHALGHDADPEGDMSFMQPDSENTFTEFIALFSDIHPGAATIGITCIAVLLLWDRVSWLKKSIVPAPLIVVILGVVLSELFRQLGDDWAIKGADIDSDGHLVNVPVAATLSEFASFFRMPDFSKWQNPAIYWSGAMIALVASLETLLNLEAVDKLDPRQRVSPPNRELFAQGVGNLLGGLIGAIPVTSVIVRSSVNIHAGGQTKLSTLVHGSLLLICVMFFPTWLNKIPLSALAAILLVTGFKLVSPKLIKQMWNEGRYQFVPFVITVVAIVLTDLVVGVLVGLTVSIAFILNSNLRRPLRRFVEKHLGGDVLRIELANQVSFLNRAALHKALHEVKRGGHVLIDGSNTDYIDPDILDLIRDFKDKTAPAHGVQLSLAGFRAKYHLDDQIQYTDYATRSLQGKFSPQEVLEILKEGHNRFRSGRRLTRDLGRQVNATAAGQHPLAVILSCIDSRSPAELIFDLGVGDIFSVRVAGNITSRKIVGSVEYACAVAGAKLVLVLGHTRCGAVTTAVTLQCSAHSKSQTTGFQHIDVILREIQDCIDPDTCVLMDQLSPVEKENFINAVAERNVRHTVQLITQQSEALADLVAKGRIMIVGAMYDVTTGNIEFLKNEPLVPA